MKASPNRHACVEKKKKHSYSAKFREMSNPNDEIKIKILIID